MNRNARVHFQLAANVSKVKKKFFIFFMSLEFVFQFRLSSPFSLFYSSRHVDVPDILNNKKQAFGLKCTLFSYLHQLLIDFYHKWRKYCV